MKLDKYGEVINDEKTYDKIAELLVGGYSVLIGWTDGGFDHRDILFSYDADAEPGLVRGHTLIKAGDNLQRGMRWSNFFISIIDWTSFGFTIEMRTDNRKHESYLMEKLRLNDNPCDKKICELVNGVIHAIDKLEGNYV